jgi:group II intron reverse transcriptase/maturase
MSTGERLQLLQRKLYLKAKQEQDYRFYVLYDKIFLDYVLKDSYERVKAAGGSPGCDNQTFTAIESDGLDTFLEKLKEELRTKQYRPNPVKRVWIPKANGGERPLGIPTIRDRVAQMACKLIIEPLFEADFKDCSYGFRPKRSAQDAIKQIKTHLREGRKEILDADLKGYFDNIPHDKLMKALSIRIADPRILHLIQLWLKAFVVEDGKIKGGNGRKKGTPQGGVISPLLANIYLHLLDRIVANPEGAIAKAGIKLVRYADDFVLMGKQVSAGVMEWLKRLLSRMELELNEEKSRMLDAKATPFNFLGFTIRYDVSIFASKGKFWNIKPSEQSCKRLRQTIRKKLGEIGHYAPIEVSKALNPIMQGWLNYFDIKGVSYTQKTRNELQLYLQERLYRYYNRKSQRKTRLYGHQAYEKLVHQYGLIPPYTASSIKITKKA